MVRTRVKRPLPRRQLYRDEHRLKNRDQQRRDLLEIQERPPRQLQSYLGRGRRIPNCASVWDWILDVQHDFGTTQVGRHKPDEEPTQQHVSHTLRQIRDSPRKLRSLARFQKGHRDNEGNQNGQR